jgi:uncharacterized protein DUF6326
VVDRRVRLSTLWIFATFNYVYADVLALFDITKGSGLPSSPQFTQGLLLGAGVLVEIPILMVFLSRELPYRVNRWANILAGAVETIAVLFAQFISPLMSGTTTSYYLFFGAIEIPTTLFIIWYAWTWPKADASGSSGATG